MSQEITVIKNTGRGESDIYITEFAGPADKGPMLQLTQGISNLVDDLDEPGFIQLTRSDTFMLIAELLKWLEEVPHERQQICTLPALYKLHI